MTLFVLLSVALAAIALVLLAWRRPVAAHVTDPATAALAVERPTRGLVIVLALVIAVVTVGGYMLKGSPALLPVTPDAPVGPGPAADAQLTVLQARAEQRGTDADAWYGAARAQLSLGHAPEAAADLRRALALRPKDANLLADTADVLAVVGGGHLDGEPMQLVERALAVDPNHVKALALKGSDAMSRRDFRTALENWSRALKVAQPDDPIAVFLRNQIEEMRQAVTQASAAAASAAGSSASR